MWQRHNTYREHARIVCKIALAPQKTGIKVGTRLPLVLHVSDQWRGGVRPALGKAAGPSMCWKGFQKACVFPRLYLDSC